MDCRNCIYLSRAGNHAGRCTHPGHKDVRFTFKSERPKGSKRPYDRTVCKEFRFNKKCSNCKFWIRGAYHNDGETPAKKGHCSLRVIERGADCPLWERGVSKWKKKPLEEQ